MTDSAAPATGSPELHDLGRGAYAYVQPDGGWWINNAGIIRYDDEAILVDTCATETRTRQLATAIESTGASRVTAVVNTHFHGDHTNGNGLFAPAPIIAKTGCAERIRTVDLGKYDELFDLPDWGAVELTPPTIEFDSALTLWQHDRPIMLWGCPHLAHTESDVVVHVPDAGVLFVGDLVFHQGTPFLAFGSIEGSLRALDWLRSFDARIVVPGHGPLATPSVFDDVERYLRFLQSSAAEAVRRGWDPLEAGLALDLGDFAGLGEVERIVGNLHRAMAEHGSDDPLAVTVDVPAVIRDTRNYVGGRIKVRA